MYINIKNKLNKKYLKKSNQINEHHSFLIQIPMII